MSEEEVQKLFEAGRLEKSRDSLAYQKVYDALKKEPELRLPSEFADRIVNLVQQKQTSNSGRTELVLAIAGGIFSVVVLIITLIVTKFKFDLGFLNAIASYRGVLFFGLAFVILLQWLDKIVLRKKESI
jgi:hypothetical protein